MSAALQYFVSSWWATWLGFWPLFPKDAISWMSEEACPDFTAAMARACKEGPWVQKGSREDSKQLLCVVHARFTAAKCQSTYRYSCAGKMLTCHWQSAPASKCLEVTSLHLPGWDWHFVPHISFSSIWPL